MGNIVPTKVAHTELSGDLKIAVYTFVPTSASDTYTFVAATHKFRKIWAVIPVLEAGQDSLLLTASAAFSGLTITVKTWNPEGTAATNWDGIVVRLVLIVSSAD